MWHGSMNESLIIHQPTLLYVAWQYADRRRKAIIIRPAVARLLYLSLLALFLLDLVLQVCVRVRVMFNMNEVCIYRLDNCAAEFFLSMRCSNGGILTHSNPPYQPTQFDFRPESPLFNQPTPGLRVVQPPLRALQHGPQQRGGAAPARRLSAAVTPAVTLQELPRSNTTALVHDVEVVGRAGPAAAADRHVLGRQQPPLRQPPRQLGYQ